MIISVGNGQFIQKFEGDKKYHLTKIVGFRWNPIDEREDAQYATVRSFDTYDEALNYASRTPAEDEFEWERRQVSYS